MSNEASLISAVKSGKLEDLMAAWTTWPGEKPALDSIIVENVDVESIDDSGETIIHSQSMSLLMLAMKHGHCDIAQWLIDNGADVNHEIASSEPTLGSTALTVAIYCDQIKSAIWLIKTGKAAVAQADIHGNTPLHHLVSLCYSFFEPNIYDIENNLVPAMLKRGANPETKNKAGKTAIQISDDTDKLALVKLFKTEISKKDEREVPQLPSLGTCGFLASVGSENRFETPAFVPPASGLVAR